MKIGHSSQLQWVAWPGIRGESARTKILLHSHEGRPDDYEFQLARWADGGNFSPRHKHVFDQFRFTLRDEIKYGPNQVIPEGCLAYFPEGAPYGPFSNDDKPIMASLQFGGPSGNGHVQRDDLRAAQKALSETGTFDKGVYTYFDEAGNKHNVDSHRAAWERATGKPLVYPEPRYADAVLFYPQNYQWCPIAPGVAEKLMAVVNERGTYAKFLRLEAGASYEKPAENRIRINFVVDGELTVGDEALEQHDAVHLDPGETAMFAAKTETTLLIYGLPAF